MKTLTAICIGDELLDGRVRDANATFLGDFSNLRDTRVERVLIVPDDLDAILAALDDVTTSLVVVSGGLGPTADDVTREAAARWADEELIEDEDVLEALRLRFAERNYPFTENNRRQATFPESARVLPTEVGTAPGFVIESGDICALFFPGVPREFRWFCSQYLADHLGETGRIVQTRLFFHGIGESALETRLSGLEDRLREVDGKVGYRADYPVIELKLAAGRSDALSELRDFVVERLGAWLVAEDDETLPVRVGRLLQERNSSVATAESCTAGGIAAFLTEAPGSSIWFRRGWVTYANEAKLEELGVAEEILQQFGAVSPQTACQMAAGARRRSGDDYAVAVSGIAGPGGGTPDKPVGTVHFGLATPRGTFHRHVHFRLPTRDLIRHGTIYSAVALLLWALTDELSAHTVHGPFTDEQVFDRSGIRLDEGGSS